MWNDSTSRPLSDEGRKNWDRIFKKKGVEKVAAKDEALKTHYVGDGCPGGHGQNMNDKAWVASCWDESCGKRKS